MRVLAGVWLSALLLGGDVWAAQQRCISLVTSAGGQDFWQQVRQGAEQSAAALQIPLYARGPTRDGDVRVQLELIERMLRFDCQVLIVAPSGPEVAVRLAQLRKDGVQGIYLDRDLGGDVAFAAVATDQQAAGREAGRQLALRLGGKGRVALLRLSAAVQSTSERERGFLEAARAGGLQVVVDRYLPVGDPQAMTTLGEELRQLDGLFTPSEGTTQEVLALLRRLGLAGKLVHIGFDASPLLVDALRRDEIAGLLVQQPRLLGQESVALALRLLDGDLREPQRVALPAIYVDRHNLDADEVRRLLAP